METQYLRVGNTILNPMQISLVEFGENKVTVFLSGGYQKEFKGDNARLVREFFEVGKRTYNLV